MHLALSGVGAIVEPASVAREEGPWSSKSREAARVRDAEVEGALFSELVQRQSRFVFRVAYAMLRNREDAEDVVQETFLKLYRNGTWQEMHEERAFLARVAWRIALDRLPASRSAYGSKRSVSDSGARVAPEDARQPSGREYHDAANLPSTAATPEENAVAAEWHAKVHRLIDALPEKLRQPLALSSIEQLDSRQIAAVLGVSHGTVRTRIMKARAVLKQKLTSITEARHGR